MYVRIQIVGTLWKNVISYRQIETEKMFWEFFFRKHSDAICINVLSKDDVENIRTVIGC